jgi:hypothetical protein
LIISAVWALSRCCLGLSWSGVLLAALLAGIEIIQRYLPAHVPEITDPLLALACAGILDRLRGMLNPKPTLPGAAG